MSRYTYTKKLPHRAVYKSTKLARKKIGIALLLIGIFALFAAASPYYTNANIGSILSPVPASILADGIQKQNVTIDAKAPLSKFVAQENVTASNFTGYFSISFPALHLTDIKVKANVDSDNAKVYEKVLSQSAAHFKGTPLPGEGGNSFIYAHSSVLWYHNLYPYSYEGIFSSLFSMKIGDPITVTIQHTTLNYIVEGITTIKPQDFNQIRSIQGVNTLTLMTCSPPGYGIDRLIIRAIQI